MGSRNFITIGERLVDCDQHCPVKGEGVGPKVITKVDGVDEASGKWPYGCVVACAASAAPAQGETGNQDPLRITEFPMSKLRACVYHSQNEGLTLEVDGKIHKYSEQDKKA